MKSPLQIVPIVILAWFASIGSYGQTQSANSEPMAAAAADSATKKWTDREKFTVMWSLSGSRDQSWTAFPKEGKFRFNSTDYCEAVPAAAKFGAEEGKFVIIVTQPRPSCSVIKLKFDLTTNEGVLEVLGDGRFSQLPGRVVRLRD
ncbi:hypothetical protein [Ramlibacter sp. AN1133]|uniref:hypothetical protein n=1 Tax=Ramlibacter sp. AN1133 TaxID=3133429 RepID=UPI0030BEBB49